MPENGYSTVIYPRQIKGSYAENSGSIACRKPLFSICSIGPFMEWVQLVMLTTYRTEIDLSKEAPKTENGVIK
jgi:hypothetical protein